MHTPAVAATWRFALLFASMATATTVDAGHQRIVTTNNVVLTGANSDPGADGRSYGVNGWASYAGENGSQGGTLYVHTTGSITVQGTIDLRGGNGGSATASPHAAGSKGGDGGWGGSVVLVGGSIVFEDGAAILTTGGNGGSGAVGSAGACLPDTEGKKGGDGGDGGRGGGIGLTCNVLYYGENVVFNADGGLGAFAGAGGLDFAFPCEWVDPDCGAGSGGVGGAGGTGGTPGYLQTCVYSDQIGELNGSSSGCPGNGGDGGNGGTIWTDGFGGISFGQPGAGGDGGNRGCNSLTWSELDCNTTPEGGQGGTGGSAYCHPDPIYAADGADGGYPIDCPHEVATEPTCVEPGDPRPGETCALAIAVGCGTSHAGFMPPDTATPLICVGGSGGAHKYWKISPPKYHTLTVSFESETSIRAVAVGTCLSLGSKGCDVAYDPGTPATVSFVADGSQYIITGATRDPMADYFLHVSCTPPEEHHVYFGSSTLGGANEPLYDVGAEWIDYTIPVYLSHEAPAGGITVPFTISGTATGGGVDYAVYGSVTSVQEDGASHADWSIASGASKAIVNGTVEFTGTAPNAGFVQLLQPNGAWSTNPIWNHDRKVVSWRSKTTRTHPSAHFPGFWVKVNTLGTADARAMQYTYDNGTWAPYQEWRRIGVGESYSDGTWHLIQRNVEDDLRAAYSSDADFDVAVVDRVVVAATDPFYLDNVEATRWEARFEEDETATTLKVRVLSDLNENDHGETVILTLGTPTTGTATVGTPSAITVTIQEPQG